MRILFCGVAAIALSGCSWLGGGYNYNNNGGYAYNQNGGYAQPVNNAPAYRAPSKFGLTGSIGTDVMLGGNAITGNNTPGLFNVHQVSMKDAYKKGYHAELGSTYKLNHKQSLSLNGFYQQAKGKSDVTFANAPGATATGTLSDFKAYGVEAGFRHNIAKTTLPWVNRVQPYLQGRVGIARVSSIQGEDIQVNGVMTIPPTVRIYEGRYVPTASALFGIEKPISQNTSIGLETGLRYIGRGNPDDSTVGGTSLNGLNNGSDRWSIPLQIRGRYQF